MFPKLPSCFTIHRHTRFTICYGRVVQPPLRIFLALLPKVTAQSRFACLCGHSLLIADIATGGGGSVTAADTRVACIQRTRCSV
ncbi:MAG: hypothetical protein [Cressdnaviricota sp.]|nr:MAG: hypothetical protein [Cressdnaviricota sp.]